MLNLDTKLSLTPAEISSPNLTGKFSDYDLRLIGGACREGYLRDKLSRLRWEQRNEAGMDLALQLQKTKSFPWPGASNVAFPLVTIAALQFHARSYPTLLNGKELVGVRVFGPDPDGEKTARSERVAGDMSWQLLEQDQTWEPQQDTNLLNLSIVGTTFKKSYYDASARHNVSELVLAKDLVLDYWAKSVESCPRKTHVIPSSKNEVRERVLDGVYRDVLEEGWFQNPIAQQQTQTQQRTDARQGVQMPPSDDTTPLFLGEQHVLFDFDQDGYAEPYIITFEINTGSVLRIVCRFGEEDVERATLGKYRGEIRSIRAEEYFTKYTFIPSPDGGIYDIGFGVFLGPLNESVNTIINQMIDCGTMGITRGGFLGRGAKVRGGTYTFAPFQWQHVDSTGDDLRKNMVPLDVPEPSMVMFQLLSLLINYTNRISGANDMMVGENPGQNTPAETSRTMVEMGQKIYNAIFKRVWRCTRDEFQKLYKLNYRFGSRFGPLGPFGSTFMDYAPKPDNIAPAADPNITSDVMRVQLATAVKQAAMTSPGYDRDAVEVRWLKAMGVEGIEQIYKGTGDTPPPPDPKIVVEQMKDAREREKMGFANQLEAAKLLDQRRLNDAKIAQLIAQAQEALANARSEESYARVSEINALISRAKLDGEHIDRQLNALIKAEELRLKEKQIDKTGADRGSD